MLHVLEVQEHIRWRVKEIQALHMKKDYILLFADIMLVLTNSKAYLAQVIEELANSTECAT